MKKYKSICIIIAAVIFLLNLPGCGLRVNDAAGSEAAGSETVGSEAVGSETAESEEVGSEEVGSEAAGSDSAGLTGQNAKPVTEESGDAAGTDTTAVEASAPSGEAGRLTEEELAEFEAFINQGNYGFLLSGYDSPEYMDLNQVLYTGAGLESPPLSEAEKKALLAALKSDELVTDVIRLTQSQIDQLLLERAGIRLKDVKTKFFWTYVPEYDSYYLEHGDTNYTKFLCESGTETNGVWKVRARGTLLAEGDYICEVTVKKSEGGGFQFLSNDIIEDDWWISENQAGVDTMTGLKNLTAAYMKSRGFSDNTYNRAIFDSDMRFYTKEELEKLNSKLYPVFRNEIYARHGYVFKNQDWNEFFRPYVWYHSEYGADIFDQACFNQFEEVNLKLIMELEEQ